MFWLSQFLTKNPVRRLGCVDSEGGENAVTSHAFFAAIDWEKLNRREIEPPFKPRIVSHMDAFIDSMKMCLSMKMTTHIHYSIFPSRKHQRMLTTLTQISLRKTPPSHPLMTLWSLPSTRRSFVTSPLLPLNCWRAKHLLVGLAVVLHLSYSSPCLWPYPRLFPGIHNVWCCHIPQRHEGVNRHEVQTNTHLTKNYCCTWWTHKHSCCS